MSRETDDTMKVINEEYDRILGNPDGMIVSDSLVAMLPDKIFSDDITNTADNHVLTVIATGKDGEDYTSSAHGSLHSISSIADGDMSVVLSTRGNYNILLQVLHDAAENNIVAQTIKLTGDNGFAASGVDILSWSLIKAKTHDFLLTINFRGSDVVF